MDSPEPSIRYKIRVKVLGEDGASAPIRALKCEIKRSARVATLLEHRDEQGRIRPVRHVYKKWIGAHWVFATLADIGYPSGSTELIPIRNQVFSCWLNPEATREYICTKAPPRHRDKGVPIICGRARRCASQQGNALFSAVVLGLMDERCHQLADYLVRWQWPDGGWNCDRKPSASTSSFWESLIPLRALSIYAKITGDSNALVAVDRATEFFLAHRLFRRRRDGEIMNHQFLRLHYPCYWRYDILFALKVMAESGVISDSRCNEALDILESKSLRAGGWPAEERFYHTSKGQDSGCDRVSWGGVSKKRMNEWVTADVLHVLKAAGRLHITANQPTKLPAEILSVEANGHGSVEDIKRKHP